MLLIQALMIPAHADVLRLLLMTNDLIVYCFTFIQNTMLCVFGDKTNSPGWYGDLSLWRECKTTIQYDRTFCHCVNTELINVFIFSFKYLTKIIYNEWKRAIFYGKTMILNTFYLRKATFKKLKGQTNMQLF